MNPEIEILASGPSITIQDRGRPGYARYGLSAGGAMDLRAMAEGALLCRNEPEVAALEMAAYGGRFRIHGSAVTAALTGAPMQARLDGAAIPWRTGFVINPGQTLEIGSTLEGPLAGTYGYLHLGGGIEIDQEINARGTHLRAGIGGTDGKALQSGTRLPIGNLHSDQFVATCLPGSDYLAQRNIRIMWGPHADRFKNATRERLVNESFSISPRRDRMAMRLNLEPEQRPFEALLTGLSDPIQIGDIQMTGDGVPAILVREHQPTGGYPRIATVIRADLSVVAQLPTGAPFKFELVDHEHAVQALQKWQSDIDGLVDQVAPVVRSVEQIDNLLSYNLVGGVVSAEEDEK